MRTLRVLASALVMLALSTPAAAWDPDRLPAAVDPSDDMPAPDPDPAPYVAPAPGLYYVTDTYAGDVVTRSGSLTTYATATVHESTGSWARVLDTVATGEASAFDGAAFNGRAALTDGRPVAGTYYESYVLTPGGFVPVSIVFFQDDAELARLRAQPAPEASQGASAAPVGVASGTPRATPGPCCVATAPPTPAATPRPTPRVEPIVPGVALGPTAPSLARIEVVRGRRVALWLRAGVGGRDATVRSWTLLSGEPGDADATSGAGASPFVTSWERLAPPGDAYELRFRLVVATSDGDRSADAAISVVVRSPALAY